MDTEKRAVYFRIALILLGWGGICFLLYLFIFSPSTETEPQTKPKVQVGQPKKTSSSTKSPPPTIEQQNHDPFQLSFSENEIDEAKEVVDQFVDVIYEGERTGREEFINQLKPYVTDSYLNMYRQSNGLGEILEIKEKHIRYVEQGNAIPTGTIGFNTTVITDKGDYFSTMYYLIKENGKWRIIEEADGLVPED